MAPRTDSRQRFIDAAADLFHTRGYHATGLNQLVSAGGAPKGSLYFHFPGGKEQLAAEAVEQSGRQLRAGIEAIFTAGGDLTTVFDMLAAALIDSDFERGCPLATIALDAAHDSEPIRQTCVAGFDSWRATIENFLTDNGIEAGRAVELSTVTLAMIEGALLLSKIRRDTAPLRAVADHLHTTMERELS